MNQPLIITTRQTVTTQDYTSAPNNNEVDSTLNVPAASKTSTKGAYAYVFAELKMIGILTCIVLAILIVLALIIPKS